MLGDQIEGLASIDTWHWFFRVRRLLIDDALVRLGIDRDGRHTVLDVGCGPGGTTATLASVGPVTAIDPSPIAGRYLMERMPEADFHLGGLDDLDHLLDERTFDLVCCFGALNQASVPNPAAAIGRLAARVAPGGGLLIDEPADDRLRRQMDRAGSSVRRFELGDLGEFARSSGLIVLDAHYVHGWAWPIARMLAWHSQLRPKPADHPPSELMNRSLDRTAYRIARLEHAAGRRGIRSPRGTGCWVVAQRPTGENEQRQGTGLSVRGVG
ncbi:MAG: class I SAM-dependent methyltransferase [Actinobacteria bacterium]|nr:class I SAM-dependent methyltransferase [Actinomycetota bacterium]